MSAAQSGEPEGDRRDGHSAHVARLAELVVHLTDCAPERALRAVESARPTLSDPIDQDAALAVVARAVVAVRRVDLRDRVDLRETTDVRDQATQAQTPTL